ncbi:HPP family protein [Arthrobacter agilis]|uniref:HPP family protein n=1 Tax=Arthrobacter agilis TaxID=37921 RepID=UPI000B357823|nr:HPP family protein [Arthrobacter agilis]OUM43193.1 HPP family protein [Arthrobacter agilis]PPB47675.1 HPP family protein [Arthrobacter agilis]TPV25677.1 HPP family protein [Arthrobacter agilis]VDR33461.1 HPP family [Arthrobacter agilis]
MSPHSLHARLRASHHRVGSALYAALLSLIVLAASGAVGLALHAPWLFPSLGPTVMLFFESPGEKSSRPSNALIGHGVGFLAGAACLYGFGLQDDPSAPAGGLTPAHLAAGALSVALTTLVLTWAKKPHPPAGATTLIISLGILSAPAQLLSMLGAIVLITAVGWGLNILLGTKPAPATSG